MSSSSYEAARRAVAEARTCCQAYAADREPLALEMALLKLGVAIAERDAIACKARPSDDAAQGSC